jgi:hypothetical protein
MLVGNNESATTKNAGESSLAISIAMRNADAAVRRRVQRPMEHIQGFSRSHWMPPLGECSHRIAATAAMVDDFGRKHKTLTKNYF